MQSKGRKKGLGEESRGSWGFGVLRNRSRGQHLEGLRLGRKDMFLGLTLRGKRRGSDANGAYLTSMLRVPEAE